MGAAAFVNIVLLWFLILFTVLRFWHARKLAGVLLIPYLGWVSFAMLLNRVIWHLNPHMLH